MNPNPLKPHNGGPCPVDGLVTVEIKFRDGQRKIGGACLWDWSHQPDKFPDLDIVAYREVV